MNLITDSYRPIEIYVIIQKSKIQFIDMILLVLSELLSKNVLAIDYHTIGQRVEAGNLKIGSNYKYYQSTPIDQIFLHLFKDDPNLVFHFQYALLIGIEKASSKYRILRLLKKSPKLQENLKKNMFSSIFGKVKLNKNGKRLSEQIGRELLKVKQKLNSLISNSESNQEEILKLIRNRYYFLNNYKVQDIFGENTFDILHKYKSEEYDIQYELSLEYFRKRLQLAHIEKLKMDDKLREFEIERNGDGFGGD